MTTTDSAPPSPSAAPSQRTTSHDLSDLLGQLGDDANSFVPAVGSGLTDPRDLERPGDAAAVVVESTGAINFRPEFASFAARAGGWVIDTVITTAAVLPGVVLFGVGSGIVRLLAVALGIVGAGLVAWSYTASIAASGQWVGNRVTSTKVVHVSSGDLLDRPHAFTRFVLRAAISPILFGGFIVALTNTSRRTFHDLGADSIVTRPTRATWSIDDASA